MPLQTLLFLLVLFAFNGHFKGNALPYHSLSKAFEYVPELRKLGSGAGEFTSNLADDSILTSSLRAAYSSVDTKPLQLVSALDPDGTQNPEASFTYLLQLIRSDCTNDRSTFPYLLLRVQKTVTILSKGKPTLHHQLVLLAAAAMKYRDTASLGSVLVLLLSWKSDLPLNTEHDFFHTCTSIIDLARELGDPEAQALVKTELGRYMSHVRF
jgi:hypothetical protein